jgi:hypothetical protein
MMKKLTIFALVCVFALGACLPAPTSPNTAPTVDIAATVRSISNTAIAQTLTAQPSPTPTLVVDIATPTLLVEASPTLVNTDTPPANLTTTPATATSGPADLTAPATFTPTIVSGAPTLTPTLGILTYGTLPPSNRPYTKITLVNKSKTQAYISLQVVTDQGYTIIEYPVKKTIKVSIPTGSYTYVVWVGGRQFIGYFNVAKGTEPTVTIFKDKVIVTKGSVSYP